MNFWILMAFILCVLGGLLITVWNPATVLAGCVFSLIGYGIIYDQGRERERLT